MQVATLIRVHRVRGHLIADLDPLRWKEPTMHAELDPATYGLTIWDLDREFLTGGVGGVEKHDARRHAPRAARRVLPHDRHRVHAHPGPRRAALDPGEVEGVAAEPSTRTSSATSSSASTPPRRSRSSSPPSTSAQKRFGLEGAESAIPILDADPRATPPTPASTRAVIGMAHRGRLNVLANIVGKSYDQIFKEFEGNVDPTSMQGSGDVKYHLGADRQVRRARPATTSSVELAANPSHLEAVDPVVRRHGPGQAGPASSRPGSYPVAADPDPRRRRVRRPGRGGRDACR